MTMLRYSGGKRTSGYVLITDPDAPHGLVEEGETLSCAHCQAIWVVKPGSGTKRGWCFNCNAALCGKGQCLSACVPFEKAIELMERRGRLFAHLDKEMAMARRYTLNEK